MKRPTRKQLYEIAVILMRGLNALMIWLIIWGLLLLAFFA